jgi:aryl-alcohol dehydrogenase-like predicted oxidoreductase
MEYRNLGRSGLQVPVLSLGASTFGGTTEFFSRWGQTDVKEASRLVDVCLDHGVNFFDTADVYGSEERGAVAGESVFNQLGFVSRPGEATRCR